MNLSKEIGYLESKLLVIALCLKVLPYRNDPKCLKYLNDYGYRIDFSNYGTEQYFENIEQLAKRAGAIRLAIEQKRKELEGKHTKISGKPITRATYTDILATLSKHMGFRIDPTETTVSEFISYRKNYEREIEAMNKTTEPKPMPGGRTSNIR